MSVARGCWFAQRVGGWRKEGTTFVGCWMEKRKACAVHGSENQKQEGWLCFFLFKWRERPEEEDETGLGFFVFGSSFLKNYPLLNIFLPQCVWLEVHLYRKSLHMLFKEILQ
jgi:hypothetical protein